MSNWTAGYIAEINYTHGFYREQAPTIHALVGLLSRRKGPDPSGQLTYCELLLHTIRRSSYVDKPADIMGWQSTGIVNSHVPQHTSTTHDHSDPKRLNAYVSALTSCEEFGLIRDDSREGINGISQLAGKKAIGEREKHKREREHNKQCSR